MRKDLLRIVEKGGMLALASHSSVQSSFPLRMPPDRLQQPFLRQAGHREPDWALPRPLLRRLLGRVVLLVGEGSRGASHPVWPRNQGASS